MTIYSKFDKILDSFTACIGFFDGVHKGHQFLLEHLKAEAKAHGTLSAVVTFSNHPRKVVQPDFDLKLIDSLDERLAKLEACGVDACFLIDFTEEVRQLTAEAFIREILSEQMHITRLLIGYDHRFGRNRAEGFDDYVRYGKACGMEVVQEQVLECEDLHYSSSEVRRALSSGKVELAVELLGKPYEIRGTVVHGFQVGRKISFPTANLVPLDIEKIIPECGVYATLVTLPDGRQLPAMANIGTRPTVHDDKKITLEANILGFEGDLYDQQLSLSFMKRIRDERKMASLDELKEQLKNDLREVEEYFNPNRRR